MSFSNTASATFLTIPRELRDEIYAYYILACHDLVPAIGNRYASPRPSLGDCLSTTAARSMLLVSHQVSVEYREELFKYGEMVVKFVAPRQFWQPELLVADGTLVRVRDIGPPLMLSARYARFHVDFYESPEQAIRVVRNWLAMVSVMSKLMPALREIVLNVVTLPHPRLGAGWIKEIEDHVWMYLRSDELASHVKTVTFIYTPGTRTIQPLEHLGKETHVLNFVKDVFGRDESTDRFQILRSARIKHMVDYGRYCHRVAVCKVPALYADPTALTYNAAMASSIATYERWVLAGAEPFDDLRRYLHPDPNEENAIKHPQNQRILHYIREFAYFGDWPVPVPNREYVARIFCERRRKVREVYGDAIGSTGIEPPPHEAYFSI